MKRAFLCSTVLLGILLFSVFTVALDVSRVLAGQQGFEVDCEAVVTRVVDGDTVYVYGEEGFKAGETFKVRFADVNAPELYTPEGQNAKSALLSLIEGKEVILDVDDLHIYDKYGRVVAVVYLQADESKLINVNYWLVVNGYAEITDYDNEFDPSTWTLYVEYVKEEETTTPTPIPTTPITVAPDKDSYAPGESLNVSGTATPNAWVTIQLFDPEGNRKAIAQSQAAADGSWSQTGVYVFAEEDLQGTWTVKAYDSSTGETAEATFTFPASAPSVEVSRSLDRGVVKPGEALTVTITYTPSEDVIGLIITEKLPLGFKLTSATPKPNMYSEAEGIVKWLFKSLTRVKPGTITYTLLASKDVRLGAYRIEGEWAAASPIETTTGIIEASQFEVKKASSNIIISISPSEVKVGGEATLTGRIKPPHEGVEVTITYARVGEVEATHKATTRTDGSFTDTFKPDTSGTWTVQASWPGDYDHEGAESGKVIFTVVKIPTTITLSVLKETLRVDGEQEVAGKINPPIRGVEISLVYIKPDGTTITRRVATSAEGSFKDLIKPDMGGTWNIIASWKGDEVYKEVKGEVGFTVTKIPTSLELSPLPSEVEVGKKLTITGKISPSIPGVEITLTYTKAGGVKITHTVTASSDGSFKDVIVPDAGGTWTVQAGWRGNEKYEGAASSKVAFEAVEKRCIIATSTYGSEMAEEVQFLRGFRESVVYSTSAGRSFMKAFNAWYYSWSPYVAHFISQHDTVKWGMKGLLLPLLSILHISAITYSIFSFNSELGIVMAGLVASVMIGAVYLSPPTILGLLPLRRRGKTLKLKQLKTPLTAWLVSIALIIIGELVGPSTLLTASTAMFVVLTVALSAGTITLVTWQIYSKKET